MTAETENYPDVTCREDDGCPTEGAVLKREWRNLRAALTAVMNYPGIREYVGAQISGMADVALMGPNVEFSGGAPLHGAASAGTKG